jgi:hypothetical protein
MMNRDDPTSKRHNRYKRDQQPQVCSLYSHLIYLSPFFGAGELVVSALAPEQHTISHLCDFTFPVRA